MLAWLDRIYAAPVWLMTRGIVAVSLSHPWHERRFSLEDWRLGRTPLTKQVDMTMWVSLACMTVVAYRLITLPKP